MQFPNDDTVHEAKVVNGLSVQAGCGTGTDVVDIRIRSTDGSRSVYAWGTKASGTGPVSRVTSGDLTHGGSAGDYYGTGGSSVAEIDVVAESTAAGQPVKWTRFDLTAVRGTKCNFHGLITPPS